MISLGYSQVSQESDPSVGTGSLVHLKIDKTSPGLFPMFNCLVFVTAPVLSGTNNHATISY